MNIHRWIIVVLWSVILGYGLRIVVKDLGWRRVAKALLAWAGTIALCAYTHYALRLPKELP